MIDLLECSQPSAPHMVLDLDRPLATQGEWSLLDTGDDTGTYAIWREVFQAMFPFIADQVQQRWPLPEGVQAHAALCGESINRAWNGDRAANTLGFQGLLARSFEWDDEVEEEVEYIDLPQWHVCYVNLAAHHRESLDDDLDTASIIASLATLAHEMAHVALFARHTNGENSPGDFRSRRP